METLETAIRVNDLARRTRHLRNFSKGILLKTYILRFVNFGISGLGLIGRAARDNKVGRFFHELLYTIKEWIPASPQKKLIFQAVSVSATALLVSAFTPGATFTSSSLSYSTDYINEYYFAGDIVVDEDGYLVKINPQTDYSSRIGLTDYAVHTVESGESLSVIAEKYSISADTLVWENSLGNANSLRVGQKLMIPPVSGISYTVAGGDNLDKLADKFKISKDSIVAQNNLGSDVLVKGQELFLPGAVPAEAPRVIANTPAAARSVSVNRDTRSYANVSSSSAAPTIGKVFIFPTAGSITNGYKAGHYAIDIADSSKPPVWAAGGGTVEKVTTGTWGGGYGNHVVINHGNGLKSLYAHLDSVNVSNGQSVGQGDVIGIMGNTGRVYGRTGIHLHWEVIQDGVKQYPGNFY